MDSTALFFGNILFCEKLELYGININEGDNTAGSDLDFLEEVMDLNEELVEKREPSRLISIRCLCQSEFSTTICGFTKKKIITARLDEFERQLNLDFTNGG